MKRIVVKATFMATMVASYDLKHKYPAIVVAHPNGGRSRSQACMPSRLAEQGYITIAMDAAYQGNSGGEPRNVDKPVYRIEDIHGAADFITQRVWTRIA